jgi:uncharacterized metal-binding protein YceD (DUF177 family)
MDDQEIMPTEFGQGEFSHIVRADDVPPNGMRVAFEADAATCGKLAARFQVDGVEDLHVVVQMAPFGKRGLMATGRVTGRVQQPCSVTLQPVWTGIEVDFTNEFQPADIVAQFVIPEDDFEAEVPDAMQDGEADLGEAVTQIFAMEVPAYPRAQDAQFDDFIDPDDDLDDKPPSPFAALQGLKLKGDDA